MIEHTQFGNSSAMDIEHMQSLNESLTGRKIVNTDIDNEIIQIVFDTEGSGNDFQPPKIYTTSIKAHYSSQTSMGVTDSGQLHSETTKELSELDQSCFYECDTPLHFIDTADSVPLIDLTDDQSDYDSQASGEINDRSPSDSEGQLPKELPDIVPSGTEDQVEINFIDSPEPNNEAEHSKAVNHSMQPDYEQSQSSIEISDSSMSDNDSQAAHDNNSPRSHDNPLHDNDSQLSQDSDTPPVIESSLLFGSNQMISDYQTEETLFDTTQADKENCPSEMLIVSLVSDNESQNSRDSDDQPLQDSDSQKSMDSDTQADIGASFQPSEADKENSSEEILTVNLVSDSDSQNSVDNDVSMDSQNVPLGTSHNSPEEQDEASSPNILIHSIEIYKEADPPEECEESSPGKVLFVTKSADCPTKNAPEILNSMQVDVTAPQKVLIVRMNAGNDCQQSQANSSEANIVSGPQIMPQVNDPHKVYIVNMNLDSDIQSSINNYNEVNNETSPPEDLLVTSQSDNNNKISTKVLKDIQSNLPAPRKVLLVRMRSEENNLQLCNNIEVYNETTPQEVSFVTFVSRNGTQSSNELLDDNNIHNVNGNQNMLIANLKSDKPEFLSKTQEDTQNLDIGNNQSDEDSQLSPKSVNEIQDDYFNCLTDKSIGLESCAQKMDIGTIQSDENSSTSQEFIDSIRAEDVGLSEVVIDNNQSDEDSQFFQESVIGIQAGNDNFLSDNMVSSRQPDDDNQNDEEFLANARIDDENCTQEVILRNDQSEEDSRDTQESVSGIQAGRNDNCFSHNMISNPQPHDDCQFAKQFIVNAQIDDENCAQEVIIGKNQSDEDSQDIQESVSGIQAGRNDNCLSDNMVSTPQLNDVRGITEELVESVHVDDEICVQDMVISNNHSDEDIHSSNESISIIQAGNDNCLSGSMVSNPQLNDDNQVAEEVIGSTQIDDENCAQEVIIGKNQSDEDSQDIQESVSGIQAGRNDNCLSDIMVSTPQLNDVRGITEELVESVHVDDEICVQDVVISNNHSDEDIHSSNESISIIQAGNDNCLSGSMVSNPQLTDGSQIAEEVIGSVHVDDEVCAQDIVIGNNQLQEDSQLLEKSEERIQNRDSYLNDKTVLIAENELNTTEDLTVSSQKIVEETCTQEIVISDDHSTQDRTDGFQRDSDMSLQKKIQSTVDSQLPLNCVDEIHADDKTDLSEVMSIEMKSSNDTQQSGDLLDDRTQITIELNETPESKNNSKVNSQDLMEPTDTNVLDRGLNINIVLQEPAVKPEGRLILETEVSENRVELNGSEHDILVRTKTLKDSVGEVEPECLKESNVLKETVDLNHLESDLTFGYDLKVANDLTKLSNNNNELTEPQPSPLTKQSVLNEVNKKQTTESDINLKPANQSEQIQHHIGLNDTNETGADKSKSTSTELNTLLPAKQTANGVPTVNSNKVDEDLLVERQAKPAPVILESDVPDSEDSSDGSVVSTTAHDTINLNSDSGAEGGDDTSQESHIKVEPKEETMLQDTNVISSKQLNITVEITNITEDKKPKKRTKPVKLPDPNVPLRRSTRTIKRKRYDDDFDDSIADDDSDPEEVGMKDIFRRRTRPKHMSDRAYSNNVFDRPTVHMHGSRPVPGKVPIRIQQHQRQLVANAASQAIYNNMISRAATVAPVPRKVNASTQSPSPQPILPCLTDDMFVLEAPSFIVPYVYEKPSIKPFREFVDGLGNELAEQRVKVEKEEQERKELEKKVKIEKGEPIESTDEESAGTEGELSSIEVLKDSNSTEDESQDEQLQTVEKRELRKRRHDDDDDSWCGESADSDEEETDNEDTVVIKEKDDPDVKDILNDETAADDGEPETANGYFNCTLGRFVMGLGLNLVQEHVQTDLLRLQTKKLDKQKRMGHDTRLSEKSIKCLKKNLNFSTKNNEPFHFPDNKCHLCDFKSESWTAISHHLEFPHVVNGLYRCNFCAFEVRSPDEILCHTELTHGVRSQLERPSTSHQCPNCPFEDTGKVKLARHMLACQKKFKPKINLAPSADWEPPAKIPKVATRTRSQQTGSPTQSLARQQPIPIAAGPSRPSPPRQTLSKVLASLPRPMPVIAAIIRNGVTIRQASSTASDGKCTPTPSDLKPTISITPVPCCSPKPEPEPEPQMIGPCILCEICDGYIRSLDLLRNHMLFIHKVKIHPKMIYNRPPLDCQKCPSRFFTDQGLERHLLGVHGLVTTTMQMNAHRNKDSGRCPICGTIFDWNLLGHVAEDHRMNLKPAHLSYKCTVCEATFDQYRQFENHVYTMHTVLAPKGNDKKALETIRALRLGGDVTVTPRPVLVLPPASVARAMHESRFPTPVRAPAACGDVTVTPRPVIVLPSASVARAMHVSRFPTPVRVPAVKRGK